MIHIFLFKLSYFLEKSFESRWLLRLLKYLGHSPKITRCMRGFKCHNLLYM